MLLTSDMVPPKDRREFLLDHFGREVHRVNWSPADHLDPLDVSAHCTFVERRQARLADVHWSSGTVSRIEGSAAADISDFLVIFRERQRAGWYELEDGTVHETRPGSIMLYPGRTFRQGGVTPDYDFDFQIAAVPLAVFSQFGSPALLHTISHLDMRAPFNALLSAYFVEWFRTLPDLDEAQADTATRTLINLLAVAGGGFDRREMEALEAVAVARVKAAERFIAANLQRPELTPQMVAAHLGISVRQLHLDFEPTGVSAARRILAGRIALARHLLVEQPHLTILEVAYSCGFDGVSTFYRVFKAQTGTTASEYRREVVGARMAERQKRR